MASNDLPAESGQRDPLRDRVVVVTGAAGGIGAAVARHLGSSGARVVPVDRDPPGPGDGWIAADLTRPDEVAGLVAEVRERYGRVHGLVNNAGITRPTPLDELDETAWNAVHDVNLLAAVRLVRATLPLLGEGSSVVNVTSIRARRGFAGDVAYSASKGGLEAATRVLAVELAPRGVRVNAVAPGAVETPLNRDALADGDHRRRVVDRIPLRRIGTPADVAPAVAFLVGTGAAWITGTVLTVDGGQCARG